MRNISNLTSIISKIFFFVCAFLLLLRGNAQEIGVATPGKQVVAQYLSDVNQKNLKYYIYLPQNYNTKEQKNPLLIFLHGIDQVGNDITQILKYGVPKLADEGKQFPMIVISPQQDHFVGQKYEPRFSTALIHELIQHAIKSYNVDTSRIYMTGLSMGGNGCWRYAIDYPHVLAAMAPVCGQTFESETKRDLKKFACRIKHIPTRVFHGANDEMIDVHHSIDMVAAIDSCKPAPKVAPRLTIYENTGHDSWTRTYSNISGNDNIYSWFLQYRNPHYNPRTANPNVNTPHGRVKLQKIAKLPAALRESSGIVVTGDNQIWSHNDSDHPPVIFCMDTLGRITKTKKITGATNVDWEDMTSDRKFFYIGDFGNNSNNRKSLQIYKIPNPDSVKEERIRAETIEFKYKDQTFPTPDAKKNYDVEAMVPFGDSLYLFTKNRTIPFNGYVYVYKLPKKPGNYVAAKMDSIFLGKGNPFDYMITSAALSDDQKHLALLSYSKMWIFSCFPHCQFFHGKKSLIDFSSFSQKEALFFDHENQLLITDEEVTLLSPGNLYKLNLDKIINTDCPTK